MEDITEGEDNVVVTIKGDNMLRRVKNLANPSQAPMHSNEVMCLCSIVNEPGTAE